MRHRELDEHRREAGSCPPAFAIIGHCVLLVALLLGVPVSPALGQALVSVDRQATIFPRVLAYDRNLEQWAGAEVTIGILFARDNPASESMGADLERELAGLEVQTVKGLALGFVRHAYTDPQDLREWARSNEIDVVYFAPGLASWLDEIVSLCTEQGLPSLSPSREYVERGATIGVEMRGKKAKIVVNIERAEGLGMDLDPKLLQFAEIVR